jgi:hypothetical protein
VGVAISLKNKVLSVRPGESCAVELTVRNTGTVVDEIHLEALGSGAEWVHLEPEVIRLFPGTDQLVIMRAEPPRSSLVPAGPVPFAVKATPEEDPAGSAVDEGVLDVEPFVECFAELVPRTVRGRLRARSELAFDNRGNVALDARVTRFESDGALRISVDPLALASPPGSATFARVRIRPERPFWSGPPRSLPFRIMLDSDEEALGVDGTFLHEPLAPAWLGKALIAAAVALVALVVLWWAVLKPTIQSAARDAVADSNPGPTALRAAGAAT